jgi:hypothetical protein
MRREQETIKALHNWLSPDTSHKWHPADDVRFYIFIGHVWKNSRGLWNEQIAREIISDKAKALHPEWPQDLLGEVVEGRVSEGTLILDFLCALKSEHKLKDLIPTDS